MNLTYFYIQHTNNINNKICKSLFYPQQWNSQLWFLCLQVGIPFSFNDLWNRTLSLFEADFKHQGVYTCQARMTTGGPKLTKDATIIVTEKPHFKKYMAVSTLGEFGKAITVPCDVHAVPKPNLTWYRNGIPLSETPNLR